MTTKKGLSTSFLCANYNSFINGRESLISFLGIARKTTPKNGFYYFSASKSRVKYSYSAQ